MVADGGGLVTCELEDKADCYRRHRQRLVGADVPSTKADVQLVKILNFNFIDKVKIQFTKEIFLKRISNNYFLCLTELCELEFD